MKSLPSPASRLAMWSTCRCSGWLTAAAGAPAWGAVKAGAAWGWGAAALVGAWSSSTKKSFAALAMLSRIGMAARGSFGDGCLMPIQVPERELYVEFSEKLLIIKLKFVLSSLR